MYTEFTVPDEVWRTKWVPVLLSDDSRTNHLSIRQFYYSIGIERVKHASFNIKFKIINSNKWLLAKIQYGL